MNDSDKTNPREIYQRRMAARQAEAAACQRQHLLLGYIRLALVIVGIGVVWFALAYRIGKNPATNFAPYFGRPPARRRGAPRPCISSAPVQ